MSLKARLIHEVGIRATLRTYWGSDCPSCVGGGNLGYHNAHRFLMDFLEPRKGYLHIDNDFCGGARDYPDWAFPQSCDHCGAPVPKDWETVPPAEWLTNGQQVHHQVFYERLYNTASGKPEPGDLYWTDWRQNDDGKTCHMHSAGCDGIHLMAKLPNGIDWEIDGRASNCTLPEDRVHRCWVRHGEPPNIHVDKSGNTCQAGAGSIMAGNYHGFLHNGMFT